MAGFTAVPDALRAAGKSGGDSVGQLRGADCGRPVADLAVALPGSTSAGVAAGYARSWSATFGGWCDQAGQYAANLTGAANNYGTTEDGNAQRLGQGTGRIRGPR